MHFYRPVNAVYFSQVYRKQRYIDLRGKQVPKSPKKKKKIKIPVFVQIFVCFIRTAAIIQKCWEEIISRKKKKKMLGQLISTTVEK